MKRTVIPICCGLLACAIVVALALQFRTTLDSIPSDRAEINPTFGIPYGARPFQPASVAGTDVRFGIFARDDGAPCLAFQAPKGDGGTCFSRPDAPVEAKRIKTDRGTLLYGVTVAEARGLRLGGHIEPLPAGRVDPEFGVRFFAVVVSPKFARLGVSAVDADGRVVEERHQNPAFAAFAFWH